jgi:phenylpropionate dioxygenase-like ring-hydroxylating dioxygenase large terminal subunit
MQVLETTQRIGAIWQSEEARIKGKAHPAGIPPLPAHPAGRYNDPAFFELEREHLFDRVWLLAAIGNEIPDKGSYKTDTINGHPVILLRDGDGRVRAFHNACTHRGACLVREKTGRGTSFTCPYHAWNFGLDGALNFLPDEFDFPGFERGKMHLRELRCESHGALVFVSFNDEVESLDHYLGGLVDMLADVPWDGVRLYKEVDFPIDCNWKCVHDAFSETYHVQFAHNNTVHQALNRTFTARQMLRHGHNAMIVRNRAAEAGAGPQNVLDAGPAAAAGSGIELNELTRAAQRSYNIFPNLTLPVGENLMTILQAIPVSADHTIFRLRYIKVDPAGAMDTEADRATVEGFGAVLSEDIYALTGIHQSLAGGGIDKVTLGAGERFIYNFHREVDRVIGKERIPASLQVTDIELPLVD